MSYSTPRRRHSSLFERMENQIKKISKRLSVAKETYKGDSIRKRGKFKSFGSMEDRSIPTTRKNKLKEEQSIPEHQKSTATTIPVKKRSSSIPQQSPLTNKQSLNFLKTPLNEQSDNANRIIIRLQDQNAKLHHQLGKMQAICENQAYRLGFMKAELHETQGLLSEEKEKSMKENCYLTTLLDHYREKAKKYKKIFGAGNSEISLQSEQQM